MNCWKTINLEKDYGYTRMMISAISLAVLFFIMAFLCFQLTHPETRLSSHNAPLFACAFTCDIACPPCGSLDPSDEK